MARLGAVISEAIVHHYGRDELLRRLAHPFWFQSFGAVMGMDWHSSGITTSVIGALKRGLAPLSGELGLHVCGGRGKQSRRTPQELVETWKLDNTHPLDVGAVKASWGASRFVEGFGIGVFAEFLRAADKGEKVKGADNLRKGRALLEKRIKTAKPVDLSITIDGKPLKGEFLGVEVMNVPFTGPGLPLATKADLADGLLDVVCFDAGRRRDFEAWLEAPQDEQAPVATRQGKTVELVWTDSANRLDDESHGNRDKKQAVELACEKEQLKVLIPVKHPAQKAVAK